METHADHIVLISIDSLRGDSFGANRYQHLSKEIESGLQCSSTLLDELSAKGIYFKKCFSAAPFTTASHASIFTGYFPLHHGVFEYFNSDLKVKTIFEYAHEKEYRTIFQTDFPIILGEPIGFKRGVDSYYVEDENGALEDLQSSLGGKTLSFFHFGGIHYPYGFHKLKFGGDDYRQKVNELESELKLKGNDLPRDRFDEANRDGEDRELLFRYKRILEYLYGNKEYKRLMSLYFEGIDYFMERRFQPFIQRLLELLHSTRHLVILFGDHGEDWSDESKGHYKSLTAGVLHVPLIVLGDSISPSVAEYNVRTIDIAPTVLHSIDSVLNLNADGVVLNLQNPSGLKNSNLYSIAQVWLGVGKQELIDHIEKAHENQGFKQKMNTIKRGETIIENDYQLIRKFDKKGVLEKETVFRINGGSLPEGIKDSLLDMLERYNMTARHVDRKDMADESLKEQLKLLGYNI